MNATHNQCESKLAPARDSSTKKIRRISACVLGRSALDQKAMNENDMISLDALSDDALAISMCEACGENPMFPGDAQGNQWRWQDYLECVPQFRKSVVHYYDTWMNAPSKRPAEAFAYCSTCVLCGKHFAKTVPAGRFTGLCEDCECPEDYHSGLIDEGWECCPNCGLPLC